LDFDEDFDNIDNINEKEEIEGNIQGENMADDEFAEFDTLSENDILEALDELDTNKIESSFEVPKVNVQDEIKAPNENLEVNNANINEIANLISKLLNNKTLEITIKVKD
jgi:outer membrane translocation and assembly module TamA